MIKNANRRILLSGTPALARPVEVGAFHIKCITTDKRGIQMNIFLYFSTKMSGPSCSKLTMSLVYVSLKL